MEEMDMTGWTSDYDMLDLITGRKVFRNETLEKHGINHLEAISRAYGHGWSAQKRTPIVWNLSGSLKINRKNGQNSYLDMFVQTYFKSGTRDEILNEIPALQRKIDRAVNVEIAKVARIEKSKSGWHGEPKRHAMASRKGRR